ncbi:MAG TPA: PIN domain-containing protein [Planctomycetaceae bacterium]|nr:PIN domain-containing protein [Planctomycetaceae bacterium]
MALICDTGGIYALYDADDAHHSAVRAVVEAEVGPLFLPSILLAELDYLLTTRLGTDAELDFLEGLTDGAYVLIHPTADDLIRCRELIAQYRDLSLGLADASVVATAERLRIPRLLTVDERHFRAVQPQNLSHFILLPADSA